MELIRMDTAFELFNYVFFNLNQELGIIEDYRYDCTSLNLDYSCYGNEFKVFISFNIKRDVNEFVSWLSDGVEEIITKYLKTHEISPFIRTFNNTPFWKTSEELSDMDEKYEYRGVKNVFDFQIHSIRFVLDIVVLCHNYPLCKFNRSRDFIIIINKNLHKLSVTWRVSYLRDIGNLIMNFDIGKQFQINYIKCCPKYPVIIVKSIYCCCECGKIIKNSFEVKRTYAFNDICLETYLENSTIV
jgi:hypothetical protein